MSQASYSDKCDSVVTGSCICSLTFRSSDGSKYVNVKHTRSRRTVSFVAYNATIQASALTSRSMATSTHIGKVELSSRVPPRESIRISSRGFLVKVQ